LRDREECKNDNDNNDDDENKADYGDKHEDVNDDNDV
jgi:hypothetical protein